MLKLRKKIASIQQEIGLTPRVTSFLLCYSLLNFVSLAHFPHRTLVVSAHIFYIVIHSIPYISLLHVLLVGFHFQRMPLFSL
jgi:hypothetical protein